MTTQIRVEHLARVEGHGGVTVSLSEGRVDDVQFDIVEGARLLEGIVRGRRYDEIAPLTSRICSICSAAHTLTSIMATEQAFGVVPSVRTERLRDLLLRGENIQSHALHIFLLAFPDFVGAPSVLALAAERREVVDLGLRLKRLGNAIQEAVGGRAVHPVTPVVGGFTRSPAGDALYSLRTALQAGRQDAQDAVALVADLPRPDFGRSSTAYAALHTPGGYAYLGGHEVFVDLAGRLTTVPVRAYRSLVNERTVAHSHARHSRWDGTPFMVGALARLVVNGQQLPAVGVRAASALGLVPPFEEPLDNTRAQAVELCVDVEHALDLVEQLLADGDRPDPPAPVTVQAGGGTAAVEAPRGLLVHCYEYDGDGRLTRADVVTPTAMNQASVEHRLRHAAERYVHAEADELRHVLETVIRAYDPCLSCAVHLLDARGPR